MQIGTLSLFLQSIKKDAEKCEFILDPWLSFLQVTTIEFIEKFETAKPSFSEIKLENNMRNVLAIIKVIILKLQIFIII